MCCGVMLLMQIMYIYIYICIIGMPQIGSKDILFLSSRASFYTIFFAIVLEVKASGQPHVFNLCLCLFYLLQQILFFLSIEFLRDDKAVTKIR